MGLSWNILMGRRMLSSQPFCRPYSPMAQSPMLFEPAIRGAVAPRHASETANTIHAAPSGLDCHRQGAVVQIAERVGTMGDRRALRMHMQMQMQCACRS